MDKLERETAAVLLEAAAINYARWQMAYTAQFHNLPGDKLDEAIRAGDEARRQLYEAAHRYVGEPPMLAELVKALGWQGGTVHQVIAEARRLRELEQSLGLSILAPTAPGLERP